jgi:hypothetical protein
MSRFNHNYSSTDRIVSGHGMNYLNNWGIIRGTSGNCLNATNKIYENCIGTVTRLHNYIEAD